MSVAPFIDPLVLIVDDDELLRAALEDLIAREGYRTSSARNGREALDYLRAHRESPCVVLLDLLMPVMDGRAVIEALRREEIDARIIVLTGGDATDLPDGVRWLRKPVDRETLLAAIAEASP